MKSRLVFDAPILAPRKGGVWELRFQWAVMFRDELYVVPAGFRTDGASIPRPLWWICGTPLDTPRLYAAIIHDYLYGGGDPEATRADADDIYRDIQIACGVRRWKAYLEWAVLRLVGWTHWTGAHVCDSCANLREVDGVSRCAVSGRLRSALCGADICEQHKQKGKTR